MKTKTKTTHNHNNTKINKNEPAKTRKVHQKPAKRIKNWKDYNAALVKRGNVEFLIKQIILDIERKPFRTHKSGKPQTYCDELIIAILLVRELEHKTLREAIGFIEGELRARGIVGVLPHYSTLSRRASKLHINIIPLYRYIGDDRPIVACPDSTGIKISGEGEWKVRKHGKGKRRGWLELHILIDFITRDILAVITTGNNVHDNTQFIPLLAQASNNLEKAKSDRPLDTMIGDGAYDANINYRVVEGLGVNLIVPPPKNAFPNVTMKHRVLEDRPGFEGRNKVVKEVMKIGLDRWKEETGYHRRSLVENTFSRLKQIFGEKSSFRTKGNQRTEFTMKAYLLNYFNTLGLPEYRTT